MPRGRPSATAVQQPPPPPGRPSAPAIGPAALEVRRPRGARLALGVVAALALLALARWSGTHPTAPLTPGTDLRASVPAGRTVYLGVYAPDPDGGRTRHLGRVDVTLTGDAVVEPLVCRGGALGDHRPGTFCRDRVPARGWTPAGR